MTTEDAITFLVSRGWKRARITQGAEALIRELNQVILEANGYVVETKETELIK